MAKARNKKKRPSRSRLVRKRDGAPVVSGPKKKQPLPADHPTISACMIVKNEREHLPRCLESIKGLVDEIVIVDTGSTDNTVEIAESFGARIYHHKWENDFAKARNISIEYGTGDWIFIIDADEELEPDDLPLLQSTLYETDFKALSISVYNIFSPQQDSYTSFLPSIRFFRRETGARYEGIVHNMLRLPEGNDILRLPVRLKHYGYGLAKEKMARKIERTKTLLLKQLEENPDYAFAHFNLAQLLRGEDEIPSSDKMDQVIYHGRRAVELSDPQKRGERHIHLMALHQVVTGYFNKNEYDEAEKWCHRALALRPDYLDAILTMGHIHSSTGRLDLARKYYLEYLDRQKNYDEHGETEYIILLHLRSRHNALYGLGLVCEMENNYSEAITWFDRCARERENYLDLQYRWALAHYRLNEFDQARQHWEKQLKLDPQHGNSHVFLGEVLHRMGRIEEAEEHLVQALELGDQHSIACYRLAIIERERKNLDQALAYINRMLAYDPKFTDGYRLRADIYFDLGDYTSAAEDYERRCLPAMPDDCGLLNNLGNCRFRQGDYVAAEELYRRAAGINPDFGEALRNWGLVLSRLDRVDDACAALEEYVKTHPDDIETAGFLGDLYYKLDDVSTALKYYEVVVAVQSTRVGTWLRLADCHYQQGHLNAALLGYEKVLQLAPEHQPTFERLQQIREHLAKLKTFGEAQAEAEGRLVRPS